MSATNGRCIFSYGDSGNCHYGALRLSLLAMALVFLVTLFGRDARADDWETCQKSESDDALAACSRAIEVGGLSGQALSQRYVRRGEILVSRGNYDQAIQDYDAAITADTSNAAAFQYRCVAYQQKHDYARSADDCSNAIRLDPTFGKAFNSRAVTYYYLEDYGQLYT